MKKSFEDYIQKSIKKNPGLKDELSKAVRALEIGEKLRCLRTQKKFTQQELGNLIGVTQSNIARIENANYDGYSIQTLQKVVEGLGAGLDLVITTEKKLSETLISSASFAERWESYYAYYYKSAISVSYALKEEPNYSWAEWKYPEDKKAADNFTAFVVWPNILMNRPYSIS